MELNENLNYLTRKKPIKNDVKSKQVNARVNVYLCQIRLCSTGTKKTHILIGISLGKIVWCESKALMLQTVQHHLLNIVRLIGNGKES